MGNILGIMGRLEQAGARWANAAEEHEEEEETLAYKEFILAIQSLAMNNVVHEIGTCTKIADWHKGYIG